MDEVIEERFKRVDDENERQNKRLEILEQNVATTQELASSVKELAISMNRMLKEQEKQGCRIEKLEQKPAESWNNMTRTVFNTVLGAVIGLLMSGIIYAAMQAAGR